MQILVDYPSTCYIIRGTYYLKRLQSVNNINIYVSTLVDFAADKKLVKVAETLGLEKSTITKMMQSDRVLEVYRNTSTNTLKLIERKVITANERKNN